MSIQDGLEVVVPVFYDLRRVPALVDLKKNWIESTRKRFASLPKPEPIDVRPREIHFPALNQKWTVEYVPTEEKVVRIKQSEAFQLRVSGCIENDRACCAILVKWFLHHAHAHLVPWLVKTSEEVNLPFTRATVRLQRSRWGSCSRHRTISLNARLLFLPPEVVRYLFIHELCHTVHMNHSARFWRLVEEKEQGYKALDKQMTHGMRLVPGWAAK